MEIDHIQKEVQLHAFLTLALHGREWSDSRLGRFTTEKETRYQLKRMMRQSQIRSARFGKETNRFSPSGF
jgi:hypothetical protein